MKECPPGKSRNPRTGRCVKDCPPEAVRDPTTGRCRVDTQKFRSQLDAILSQLRKPRLADTSFPAVSHKGCIQAVPTEELQEELERRRRINVLIPRKKVKK